MKNKHKIGDKVIHIIDDCGSSVQFSTRTIEAIKKDKAGDGSYDYSYKFTGGDVFHSDYYGESLLTISQAKKFLKEYLANCENYD